MYPGPSAQISLNVAAATAVEGKEERREIELRLWRARGTIRRRRRGGTEERGGHSY